MATDTRKRYVKLKEARIYPDVYEFDIGKRFVLAMEYHERLIPAQTRLTLLDKQEQTEQSMIVGPKTFRRITKGKVPLDTIEQLRERQARHFDYQPPDAIVVGP